MYNGVGDFKTEAVSHVNVHYIRNNGVHQIQF